MSNKKLHIAMIMDGNRRYAVKKLLPKVKGHKFGAKTFSEIAKSIKEIKDVNEFSFYTFSVQNFNRNQKEVDYIMNLFKEFFQEQIPILKKDEVKIKFLGRLELFPEEIQTLCKQAEDETKDFDKYRINFCFGYGGREELVDATKAIAKQIKEGTLQPEEITEETINNKLYSNHQPDMVIRTGGDNRTSNFLPWQTTYSEWFFLDKLWPEFKVEDLKECISKFNKRERRFGK